MHFFDLVGLRHVLLFIFPTFIFIILLGIGLGRVHFRTKGTEGWDQKIRHVFPGGIEERSGPVPLLLILIMIGFLLWGFFYILTVGILGIRI